MRGHAFEVRVIILPGFVGNPLLTCQRELRVLHQRDLLLKPNDQFVTPLNCRISGCKPDSAANISDLSCVIFLLLV